MEEAQPFILNDDDRQNLDLLEKNVKSITKDVNSIKKNLNSIKKHLNALMVASQVPSQLDEAPSARASNLLFENEFPDLMVSSPSSAPSTIGDPPYSNQASTPIPFMVNDLVELDEFGQPWMDTTIHPLNPTNLWLFYKKHYATCYPLNNHPQFCELFGTTITTLSQRTIAKDAVLPQDCLPFTAAMYHNDHPAYLQFQDVSKCQYLLSRLTPFSHDLHENRQNFAAIRQELKKDFVESRQDSVPMTTIEHGDLTSDSNQLQSSYPNEVFFDSMLLLSPTPNIDKSDHSSSSHVPSDSKLLLLPSPAPNIAKSDPYYDLPLESKLLLPPSPAPNIDKSDPHSSSGDVLSASKLLLPPSPAPNIDKSTDPTTSSSDMPSDSQLLLPPSPAPNIIQQSDTPSSSCDLLSYSKLLLPTSPAPNIVQYDPADGSGILTLQILQLPPPPAPNILPRSDLEVDKDFWLALSHPPTIDTNDIFSPFDGAHESFSSWLDTNFFLSFATSRIAYVSLQLLAANGKSYMFPYWEYWDQAASFSHSFDLLSYKAANWLQGILVSILNQMKCLMFLDGPAPCTHHLHSFLSSSMCLPHFEDWGILASCMTHEC
jgi:hypothetical protein